MKTEPTTDLPCQNPMNQTLPPSPPRTKAEPNNNSDIENLNISAGFIEDAEITSEQLSTTITNAMDTLIRLSKSSFCVLSKIKVKFRG